MSVDGDDDDDGNDDDEDDDDDDDDDDKEDDAFLLPPLHSSHPRPSPSPPPLPLSPVLIDGRALSHPLKAATPSIRTICVLFPDPNVRAVCSIKSLLTSCSF
jgi:hypothetical protein